jgi:hypothetical protein
MRCGAWRQPTTAHPRGTQARQLGMQGAFSDDSPLHRCRVDIRRQVDHSTQAQKRSPQQKRNIHMSDPGLGAFASRRYTRRWPREMATREVESLDGAAMARSAVRVIAAVWKESSGMFFQLSFCVCGAIQTWFFLSLATHLVDESWPVSHCLSAPSSLHVGRVRARKLMSGRRAGGGHTSIRRE